MVNISHPRSYLKGKDHEKIIITYVLVLYLCISNIISLYICNVISKQNIDDYWHGIQLHVALHDNGRQDVNNDVSMSDAGCKRVG